MRAVATVEGIGGLQVQRIGFGIAGAGMDQTLGLLALQHDLQLVGDRTRDAFLQVEDVVEITVVGFRPLVVTVAGPDQLGGDAHAVALLADRTFQNVRHAQCLTDIGEVLVSPLEVKRRGTTGDLQPIDLGQRVEDFLADAVGEVLLILLRAHVDEGEHGNRLLVRLCCDSRVLVVRCDGQFWRRAGFLRQYELVHCEVAQRQQQQRDDAAVHALCGLRRDRMFRQHLVVTLQTFRR